ncbi:phage tail sheath monomer [Vibrio variabilis]|uniref:Phage tail sheath monomer n=1 Tax=Vibrio variabilis TaxID=990271 RepID=A0ABQ0JR61_9VIBR|nr:phage tail sheath monomer [Vibrio variabilis]
MGLCVVVRVEDDADQAQLISNLIGGVDANGAHSGLQALLMAGSTLGIKPRLITVPEYSSLPGVGAAMEAVAQRLRAHPIIEGSKFTFADVVAEGRSYTHAYYVHPRVKLIGNDGLTYERPSSARCLGIFFAAMPSMGIGSPPLTVPSALQA